VLDAGSTTADRTGYHRAILRELGVGAPSAELLRELAAPAAGPVIELYPDARPALERLRATGVAMAVVSDTWAGLDETFRQLGVAEFFAGFVISELMGCRKPDPRMYAAGSDVLGLTPGECLFIDDDPELVAAAIALGYQGLTLDRDAERPAAGMVTSLDGIP
jgi:HAD superfamily hydrolase (TIGR01509 family)